MSAPPVRDVPDDRTLRAYIDTAADMLGLTIAPDWQEPVLFHLKAITAAANLVEAFPLDDAIEVAPVFQA